MCVDAVDAVISRTVTTLQCDADEWFYHLVITFTFSDCARAAHSATEWK